MSHVTYWSLQSDTLGLHQGPTLLLSPSCLNLHGFQSTCNPGWSYPVHLPIPSPCSHNLGNKHSCTCEKYLQILFMVTTAITDFPEQLEKKKKSLLIWKMFSEYVPISEIQQAVCPLRSALFWDFTQHRMVVPYWRFRTTYWFHLRGPSCVALEYGTDRLSWNIVTELQLNAVWYPITAQMSCTSLREPENTHSLPIAQSELLYK
jgi:hypothetical protein